MRMTGKFSALARRASAQKTAAGAARAEKSPVARTEKSPAARMAGTAVATATRMARTATAARRAGTAAVTAATAAAVLAAAVPALPAEAAYTHEVRIQAGAQGRFQDGSAVKTYKDEDGDGKVSVNFDWSREVELPENSKYYVKGIRKSGTEEDGLASFTAEEDADYVVVYGIRDDNQVRYTVHYEDVNGQQLADPDEGRGNVGDTPIIAHLPIDGYQPQAYNLTKTLSVNEADNIFTFIYTRMTPVGDGGGGDTVTEETVETNGIQTVVLPGTGGGTTGGGGTTIVEDGGTTVIEGGGGAGGEAEAAGGAGAEEAPQEPEELINLDDEETPLAGPGAKDGVPGNHAGTGLFSMPPAVTAGLVSALVLLLTAIYFFVARRRQKKNEDAKR